MDNLYIKYHLQDIFEQTSKYVNNLLTALVNKNYVQFCRFGLRVTIFFSVSLGFEGVSGITVNNV